MDRAIVVVTTLILTSCASGAASAEPDNNVFLQEIQKRMPDVLQQYGSQAILTEGYRICGYEALHSELTPEVDRIVTEMPMSRHSAIELRSIATVWLDCVQD